MLSIVSRITNDAVVLIHDRQFTANLDLNMLKPLRRKDIIFLEDPSKPLTENYFVLKHSTDPEVSKTFHFSNLLYSLLVFAF